MTSSRDESELETDEPTSRWYSQVDPNNRSTVDSGICVSGYQSIEENLQRLRIDCGSDLRLQSLASAALSAAPIYSGHVAASASGQNPVQLPSLEELFRQDEDGDTQLHLAIIQPNVTTALWLISVACIPDYLNIQNNNFLHTPLHLAVITNQPNIVRALVLSGASLTMRDKYGNTPLHHACLSGHLECVQQLTVPINEGEKQYMFEYCAVRQLPPRNILTMQPSDICLLNYEGETCLHLAQNSSSTKKSEVIYHLVLSCHADVNMQEGKCGYTILHQAVKSRDVPSVNFILNLPGVSVNKCCYNGCTALGIASSLVQCQLMNLLQRAGAVLSTQDRSTSGLEIDDDQMEEFDDLTIAGKLLT